MTNTTSATKSDFSRAKACLTQAANAALLTFYAPAGADLDYHAVSTIRALKQAAEYLGYKLRPSIAIKNDFGRAQSYLAQAADAALLAFYARTDADFDYQAASTIGAIEQAAGCLGYEIVEIG